MHLKMSVSKILAHGSLHMVLENYQDFIEMTSKMIHIVALGGGFKCPHKIYLNTPCGVGGGGSVKSARLVT